MKLEMLLDLEAPCETCFPNAREMRGCELTCECHCHDYAEHGGEG